MSAVIDFVSDVVSGVVEAVGDVVDTVVDVVQDVGKAIDQYVIQPILDDPLTAIATIGAATFLGPAAAAYFGTSASVGVGIAAGAANTAAGLVQGESFDEAIKGGLMAGAGSYAGAEFFGGSGSEGSATPAPSDSLDDFLAQNNNFGTSAGQATLPGGTNLTPSLDSSLDDFLAQNDNFGTSAGQTSPVPGANVQTTDLPPQAGAEVPGATAPAPSPTSPLQSLNTPVSQVEMPALTSVGDSSFGADYGLSSGMKPDFGLQANSFKPADSFNMYGEADYSLAPKGVSGGPGLQMPSAPNLTRMGGGQGLTADMTGLPQYMENGVPTQFQGANGNTYGAATPDVTVSQSGMSLTPPTTTYAPTTNMGTPSVWDNLTSGDLTGAVKTAGGNAVDWVKNASPWQLAGVGLGAASLMGGMGGPPAGPPPTPGATRDPNFNKPLDLYEYMRDKVNYTGDLTKYGQAGQGGEHQFFQNTRFVPIPIAGQTATPAKMGGLIQMKHFARGGQAKGQRFDRGRGQISPQPMPQPQTPPPPAAAPAPNETIGHFGIDEYGRRAGGGFGTAPPKDGVKMSDGPGYGPGAVRPGGGGFTYGPNGEVYMDRMPPQQMPPQQMPPQAGRPPMMPPRGMPQQPPRDPKTAYYQYGRPPAKASAPPAQMARGGLSAVNSMRIGGGADGRTDDVPAVLSDGEYVMDAETVAMLGNGSSKAGAVKLDQMRSNLRKQKGQALAQGKISPDAKSPLSYLRRV